jgi:hypothetical protein
VHISLPLVVAWLAVLAVLVKPSACIKPFAVNQSQVSSAMPIGSFLGQPKDLKVNQSMLIEDLPQAEQLGG